jgi:hypothetical protein
MLPLSFIFIIDGNLNGYVKGIEIVWLEIGNEKVQGRLYFSSLIKGWKLVMFYSYTDALRKTQVEHTTGSDYQ